MNLRQPAVLFARTYTLQNGPEKEPVWWEDIRGQVRKEAREKARLFHSQGISGVDLYISTFGPVLSILSQNWPVLSAETDKAGKPLPLKPDVALDLAREEVIALRKEELLLGRAVQFDPVTDWKRSWSSTSGSLPRKARM